MHTTYIRENLHDSRIKSVSADVVEKKKTKKFYKLFQIVEKLLATSTPN